MGKIKLCEYIYVIILKIYGKFLIKILLVEENYFLW